MKNRHPIVVAALVGATFVLVSELVILFVLPAWAASFPLGAITVDLGDLAPWAGVAVAFGVWWDARRARKAAAEAAVAAVKAAEGIAVVQRQTDGVLKEVASLAKAQGRQQERAEVATAKELVRTERVADAETDAKVQAAQGLTNLAQQNTGDNPVSVSDSKVSASSERAATALERTATAAEEQTKDNKNIAGAD